MILNFRLFVGLILAFICTGTLAHAQTKPFTTCDVYQYLGKKHRRKKLILKQTFNASGQLIQTRNYDLDDSPETFRCYYYKDNLLVLETSIDIEKDSQKVSYAYNDKNQLVKKEYFTFQKRLKPRPPLPLGEMVSCSVRQRDYEKFRTWGKLSEINFTYDANGHPVLYDATKLHWDRQNKYTWTYDSLGRMATYRSYVESKELRWEEVYSYFPGGYTNIRTHYDYDGRPEHLKTGINYRAQDISTFYLDTKGRVVKEDQTTEKGETKYTEMTEYTASGQIARKVYSNCIGDPDIVEVYVYY